jgi:glutamate-1-semialdehyde 2,1-aminomutase
LWNSAAISEDCLYLNVWAPAAKHREADRKAAVMVFIHGGDFGFGGTSIAYYDGVNIVRDNKDIIVVTIKYGASPLPIVGSLLTLLTSQLSTECIWLSECPWVGAFKAEFRITRPSKHSEWVPNYLTLIPDLQRLAIEWIYDNISQFGGDPERIILFGQSVGAASAAMYSYAVREFHIPSLNSLFQLEEAYLINCIQYPNNPLIKGIVMQSGTYTTGPISRHENNWNRLSNDVGCGSAVDSMSCMLELPMSKIVDTMATGNYTFLPTDDGLTFFTDFPARAREGKIADLVRAFSRKLQIRSLLANASINCLRISQR